MPNSVLQRLPAKPHDSSEYLDALLASWAMWQENQDAYHASNREKSSLTDMQRNQLIQVRDQQLPHILTIFQSLLNNASSVDKEFIIGNCYQFLLTYINSSEARAASFIKNCTPTLVLHFMQKNLSFITKAHDDPEVHNLIRSTNYKTIAEHGRAHLVSMEPRFVQQLLFASVGALKAASGVLRSTTISKLVIACLDILNNPDILEQPGGNTVMHLLADLQCPASEEIKQFLFAKKSNCKLRNFTNDMPLDIALWSGGYRALDILLHFVPFKSDEIEAALKRVLEKYDDYKNGKTKLPLTQINSRMLDYEYELTRKIKLSLRFLSADKDWKNYALLVDGKSSLWNCSFFKTSAKALASHRISAISFIDRPAITVLSAIDQTPSLNTLEFTIEFIAKLHEFHRKVQVADSNVFHYLATLPSLCTKDLCDAVIAGNRKYHFDSIMYQLILSQDMYPAGRICPADIAIANHNVDFFLLLLKVFSIEVNGNFQNEEDIARLLAASIVKMLVVKDDIGRLAPLVEYLKQRQENDRNHSSRLKESYNKGMVEIVLAAIERQVYAIESATPVFMPLTPSGSTEVCTPSTIRREAYCRSAPPAEASPLVLRSYKRNLALSVHPSPGFDLNTDSSPRIAAVVGASPCFGLKHSYME